MPIPNTPHFDAPDSDSGGKKKGGKTGPKTKGEKNCRTFAEGFVNWLEGSAVKGAGDHFKMDDDERERLTQPLTDIFIEWNLDFKTPYPAFAVAMGAYLFANKTRAASTHDGLAGMKKSWTSRKTKKADEPIDVTADDVDKT